LPAQDVAPVLELIALFRKATGVDLFAKIVGRRPDDVEQV
jgi:UDP-glucose 4-epimerase